MKFNDTNLTLTISTLYVKAFSFIIFFTLCLTGIGSYLIFIDSLPITNRLTNFGSFGGGMFTALAILIGLKEYIVFKSSKGINNYRKFIVEIIRPIPNQMHDDYLKLRLITERITKDNVSKEYRIEFANYLEEIKHRYLKLCNQIISEYADLSFHNDWHTKKIKKDMKNLIDDVESFFLSTYVIDTALDENDTSFFTIHDDNKFVHDLQKSNQSYNSLVISKVRSLVYKIDSTGAF